MMGEDAIDDEVDKAEDAGGGRVDAQRAIEGEFVLEELGEVQLPDREHLTFVDVPKAHHGEDFIGDVV